MKRRNFLTLIGAASLSPALPAFGARASAAVGYNRYMYGLAVFHARTRVGLTMTDLMARLGVSSSQASAMLSEMTARGVLSGVTGAVNGVSHAAPRKPYLRKMLRHLQEHVETSPADTDHAGSGPADVRAVHAPCTSCDN
ncbi:MAG: hypothetical protein WBB25_06535 [Sulfitobacter sp.]